MLLEMANKVFVDWANNCSVGGQTRHAETHMYFLQDLKETAIIKNVMLIFLQSIQMVQCM
jgi:hypothetical protein